MSAACCRLPQPDPHRNHAGYKTVLWAVLSINAGMFLIELAMGFAAGSVSLQADALDFLGDAANYGISLSVAGLALYHRARAAMVKGITAWVCLEYGWSAARCGTWRMERFLKPRRWVW